MDTQLPEQSFTPPTKAESQGIAGNCENTVEQFSEETMQSLRELGDALQRIHDRLLSDGYTIHEGKIFKEEIKQNQNDGENEHK